jgi:hypothetical protein
MDGGKRFIGGMRGPRRLEAPTAARHDIPGGPTLICAIRSVLIRPWIQDRRSTPQPSALNPRPPDDPGHVVRLVTLILRVAGCGNVAVLMPAFWP